MSIGLSTAYVRISLLLTPSMYRWRASMFFARFGSFGGKCVGEVRACVRGTLERMREGDIVMAVGDGSRGHDRHTRL